ncbi:MAG: WecB/TagA/CpsF family glycosyltransferase [Verrucomicrobia bacterium]|nr:WecB/TagA/CpsF family glycosyltransferase [Verrucomicrobiota bacterium]
MNAAAPAPALESGQPIAMLGVPFDNVTRQQVLARVDAMVQSRRPHYIATANVDFLVQALEDIELRRILFDADLVVCDGTPLLWASSWLGNPLPERVAGSDLVPVLLEVAAQKGYRIFFLGGRDDIAKKAEANLRTRYPGLVIAGRYSPPLATLLEMDHADIRRRIQDAQPDIVLVSFGCPKQEKWIAMNYRESGVPVSMGVGATIDFLAGAVSRAPVWMQRSGLEWIYRLLQEPKRLARRYGHDLRVFGLAIVQQWWRMKQRPARGAGPAVPSTPAATPPAEAAAPAGISVLRLPERLDAAAVNTERAAWEAVDRRSGLVLDLSGTTFIDSTGVGFLMRLRRRAREEGVGFALAALQPAVARALTMMKLADFFPTAADVAAARVLLAQAAPASVSSAAARQLALHGEVTSLTLASTTQPAEAGLAALPTGDEFTIDLAGVTFIDSSGIGALVRLRKLATRGGVRLHFRNATEPVRNVLRLTRLTEYILGGPAT